MSKTTPAALPLSVRETLRVARKYAIARHGCSLAQIDDAERWIRNVAMLDCVTEDSDGYCHACDARSLPEFAEVPA